MDKKVIDARGLSCPQPVIETKRALGAAAWGRLEVLVDTVTSRENVLRYGRSAGWIGSFEPENDGFRVIHEKGQ